MDAPSFASKLYLADIVRLHTYIRSLKLACVDAAIMGYLRGQLYMLYVELRQDSYQHVE